jgi:N-acetylneuraminic acid mutarotase
MHRKECLLGVIVVMCALLAGGCPGEQQGEIPEEEQSLEELVAQQVAQYFDQNQQSFLGAPGTAGEPGEPGRACWDANGNGEPDPGEDTNGDGEYNAEDCQGQDGSVPSGTMIVSPSATPPPGFSFTGQMMETSASYDPLAMVDVPQVGAAFAGVDDALYYIGGSGLADVRRYDLASDTWSAASPLNSPRIWAGSTVLDGQIYVSGGDATYTALEVYDPESDTWSNRASMNHARYAHNSVVMDGQIYVVAGYDGAPIATVERYDPDTNNWTDLAPVGVARYSAALAVVDGRLYAMGGHDGASPTTLVEEYDPAANTWTPVADMLQDRAFATAIVHNGRILVLSGIDTVGSEFLSIQEYNPQTDTWRLLSAMPTSLDNAVASWVDGRVYLKTYFELFEFTPPETLYVHEAD